MREIPDIELEAGVNEIEVIGLSPSIDEHSVQIDGRGPATITDLTVELVPNPNDFYDTYPEDDDDVIEDDPPDYEDSDDEVDSTKAITAEIKRLESEKTEAGNREGSAARQLEALDQYIKTAKTEDTKASDFASTLEMYEKKRSELYALHSAAVEEGKKLVKEIARKSHERQVAGKDERKQKAKEQKRKDKLRLRNWRKREEIAKEKNRVKEERLKYWPKQVYRVTLRLETAAPDTPASSRRNSLDAVTLSGGVMPDKLDNETSHSENRSLTLALSYVTSDAFWTPRYEINISSLRKTAIITYRAEFGNRTSETWTDAKLVLSTSQTSYSGLDDKPPSMQPWNVKLGKFEDQGKAGLLSFSELNRSTAVAKRKMEKEDRSKLYGLPEPNSTWPQQAQFRAQRRSSIIQDLSRGQPAASSLFGASQVRARAAFGAAPSPPGNGFVGGSQGYGSGAPGAAAPNSLLSQPQPQQQGTALQDYQTQMMLLEQQNTRRIGMARHEQDVLQQQATGFNQDYMANSSGAGWNNTPRNVDGVGEVGGGGADQLDFEESTWEDNGLTATYEVPGTRTIAPSSTSRRHKIASLAAANIQLSYIAVPKLRAAAFLRAKARNPSPGIVLLKGMAGVTLDGSFLGNMTLPRVSPLQPFTLSLGTDPAIHVAYPKPSVHRSTQGLFNKESAQTFARSVWITNTRSAAVELLVLDQIPVSQDERLRIDVLHPKGLYKEGDAVRAGQNAREGGSGFSTAVAPATRTQQPDAWGKAVASLKKNGEISWSVNLEKGQACLLKLEYEARLPDRENIVNVWAGGNGSD